MDSEIFGIVDSTKRKCGASDVIFAAAAAYQSAHKGSLAASQI
jgi:hypothetical protein